MSIVQTEQVLVVPTHLFHSLGYFQGFCRNVDHYLDTLLHDANTRFEPRGEMENAPEFKQLIPYCIFRYVDDAGEVSLFQYTRGKGQGESRLHALRSIGVGGHISSIDVGASGTHNTYEEGMRREIEEELAIDTEYSGRCVGLINDDESAVGKVHLGVVHLLEVVAPRITPQEADLINAGFEPLSKLVEEIDSFETWSQICLRALF